jgi:hypothetical protein
VPDWRESRRGALLRLEISSALYQQLANENRVALQVKPGLLGFEWVESIRAQRLE